MQRSSRTNNPTAEGGAPTRTGPASAPTASLVARLRKVGPLPYLLILPTLVFVGLFTIWPTVTSIVLSLYRQQLNFAKFRTPTFIGLGNYVSLFRDPTFFLVLLNTALYLLGTVLPAVLLGFLFAMLINRKLPAIGIARLFLFHPTVLPMVSVATIWLFLYTPDYGLFNAALQFFGYHGPENWTGNPNMALLSIIIVSVWKNAGFYMVFYLAGMQSLPLEVYEAARLDGAGPFATTLRITLPLLRRTTLFVTTIAFIGSFQTVDHVFVLTQGGPSDASNILLYYLWEVRFQYLDVGKSSALTVVLICMLLIFTVSNFLLTERGGRTDV